MRNKLIIPNQDLTGNDESLGIPKLDNIPDFDPESVELDIHEESLPDFEYTPLPPPEQTKEI